ncbi:MAG: hypothetical protein AB1898_00540 [Acidobacteriota bacterium]
MRHSLRGRLTRRQFLTAGGTSMSLLGIHASSLLGGGAKPSAADEAKGAIVICNHWTQFGIGETYPQGEVNGKWYRRNFSTVLGFERGRQWLKERPQNRICHEFDAYFLESVTEEDPAYLNVIRDLLDSGRMELPGGTYGQAESQIFGYESAIRQLTFGQAAFRKFLGRSVTTFLVEEQCFYSQLPQLLLQAGFKYASVQFQNSGTLDSLPQDLILWEAPDGSALPTVAPHPGMLSCARQWKSYDEVVDQLAGRPAPLIFQWLELWVPGLDWGASVAPYREAIQQQEQNGFRQMLLSEYVAWASKRAPLPRMRLRMDQSNYNNNFYQGGWGYENEKTARGSNRFESQLLAAEAICAGAGVEEPLSSVRRKLPELWSRLLRSQNHDPYLAGSVPAYLGDVRSFQSELAVNQFSIVKETLQSELGLGKPISADASPARFFNPCPWPVNAPVLIELDETQWPDHCFTLKADQQPDRNLDAVFRSDEGNVLVGPVMLNLPGYGSVAVRVARKGPKRDVPLAESEFLLPSDGAHTWKVMLPHCEEIVINPLVGEWRQVPSFFYEHPNVNAEAAHTQIEAAPVNITWRSRSEGVEVATWRQDLMRIKEVPEPALSVQGMAMAGLAGSSFVEFRHRLTSNIRFATGKRPAGTWRFQVRLPADRLRIVADSPFAEEEHKKDTFYCSRYVRLEWPDRHILWCPSQNTLFRRVEVRGDLFVECTVFDFEFTGTAQWGMRFFAAAGFTAAESMRLAESYHRQPITMPSSSGAPAFRGIAADNAHVVITHCFPAPGRGSVGLRVLNASDDPQETTFDWPKAIAKVEVADLDGRPISSTKDAQLALSRSKWRYRFRPWQIVTFCIAT